VHAEWVQSALSKKGSELLVRGGLKGVAEEVEGNIRVEGGDSRSAAKTLVWQPAPPGAVVGEGEVRRFARRLA
jgi:hypothetical protein